MRRLTRDEHLSTEFATNWPTYELDDRTRALLAYAKLLTESPLLVDEAAVKELRAAGWDERAVYNVTALIAFFNFTGRLEAAAGLPVDHIPAHARVLRAMRAD